MNFEYPRAKRASVALLAIGSVGLVGCGRPDTEPPVTASATAQPSPDVPKTSPTPKRRKYVIDYDVLKQLAEHPDGAAPCDAQQMPKSKLSKQRGLVERFGKYSDDKFDKEAPEVVDASLVIISSVSEQLGAMGGGSFQLFHPENRAEVITSLNNPNGSKIITTFKAQVPNPKDASDFCQTSKSERQHGIDGTTVYSFNVGQGATESIITTTNEVVDATPRSLAAMATTALLMHGITGPNSGSGHDKTLPGAI